MLSAGHTWSGESMEQLNNIQHGTITLNFFMPVAAVLSRPAASLQAPRG
jgi:hypothetical protein